MMIQISLMNGLALGFTIIDWGYPEEEEPNQYRYTTNIFIGPIALTIYHLINDDQG